MALARSKIQQGDIAAARRLLERASDSDKAEAWFALPPKPKTPRCWPAGEFLGSSPIPRRPGHCTRRLKRVGRKAHVSVCLLSESRPESGPTLVGRRPIKSIHTKVAL